MGFRVTNSILIRSALADVNRARERLASTQEQASSLLRINRPSDDPVGASAAMLLRAGLDATGQFQRNVSQTKARVSVAETSVAHATDLMIRAKELALTGANGTQSAESRVAIAQEIAALHASLLGESNVEHQRGYVFAGFASTSAPFVSSGPFVDTPPSSPTVAFAGDTNEILVEIDEGLTTRASFNGQRVFLGDADGDAVVDAGREDLFDVLSSLWDALMANDEVATAAVLPRIDDALSQLGRERTSIGAVAGQLEDWQAKLDERAVDLTTRLSETQDADAVTVFSELVQQETALQAALQATSRMIQPSLLDFLS